VSDVILHHYALSPFAEKIRLMLGYCGLSWQSVIVPAIPPRRTLEPLAGKYRRIPVMQIGADVFCDTRSITTELARLCHRPELALENCSEEIQAFVRRADLEVFIACMVVAPGGVVLRKLWKSYSLLYVGRFLWDRIRMNRTSNVPLPGRSRAREVAREHLEDLERRLTNQPFLSGEVPTIADFSAYHGLWFIRDLGESRDIDPYLKVYEWLNRLRAFGHGKHVDLPPRQALEIARAREPRPLPSTTDSANMGGAVRVAPDDYGQIPVEGVLVASTAQGWILARDDRQVGRVHVHFPKQGFVLQRAG
jgi:glutathione S-transferase